MQETLNARLFERQARGAPLCPIREELYSQAFDELLRQVTLECPERGILLLRVRDELRMTLAAYVPRSTQRPACLISSSVCSPVLLFPGGGGGRGAQCSTKGARCTSFLGSMTLSSRVCFWVVLARFLGSMTLSSRVCFWVVLAHACSPLPPPHPGPFPRYNTLASFQVNAHGVVEEDEKEDAHAGTDTVVSVLEGEVSALLCFF